MCNEDISNTECKPKENTSPKLQSVSSEGVVHNRSQTPIKDDYLQIRMSKKWKEHVKLISEEKGISLSKFIRTCVDRSIQSL